MVTPIDWSIIIVLLVIALLLVVLMLKYRKSGLSRSPLTLPLLAVLSLLAIGLSTWRIFELTRQEPRPISDTWVDSALGSGMADRFAPAGPGSEVVIIYLPRVVETPSGHSLISVVYALMDQLQLEHSARVHQVEPLGPEADEGAIMELQFQGVPPEALREAWQRFPEAELVFSLHGFPQGDLSTLEAEKPEGSRLVVLDLGAGGTNLDLLRSRLVDAVVMIRPEVEPVTGDDDLAELFERHFLVLETGGGNPTSDP